VIAQTVGLAVRAREREGRSHVAHLEPAPACEHANPLIPRHAVTGPARIAQSSSRAASISSGSGRRV
jgi:hypothetical protein